MKRIFLLIWFLSLFLFACDGGGGGSSFSETPVIKVFSGNIEKGALQKGATITASEWSPSTGYTGAVYSTETLDNLGGYSIESSELSGILDVRADGFFYNENTGLVENTRIILSGLVDSSQNGYGNINIVTHIIKQRVIGLMQSGSDFSSANNQAVAELYSNFGWTPENPLNTNITSNAKLLFLSAAVCKNRTVSEVSNLLTALTADMADGSVDVSALHDSFSIVDVAGVTANMQSLYGTCPNIATIKSELLTYLSLDDYTVRQITMIPVSSATFYTYCNGSLKGFINSELVSLSGSYVQKYLGETTIVSCQINNFFSITDNGTKTLYMQVTFSYDSSVKYFSQTGGELTEVSSFPEKPTFNTPLEFETDDFIAELVNGDTAVNLTAKNTGFALMNNYLYQYIETTDYAADGVSYGPGIFAVWNNSTGTNGRITWMSADTYDSYFGNVVQGNVNIW